MTEEKESSSLKMKLAIGLAAGFCIVMLALLVGSVVSGSSTPTETVADTHTSPVSQPPAQAALAPQPDTQPATHAATPSPAGEKDLTEIEIIRHKEENAAAFHQHLREYSRENPDADDALSEEQIKKLEKVGAIAM